MVPNISGKRRFLNVIVVTAFAALVATVFGRHDGFSGLLYLGLFALIAWGVLDLRMSVRHSLKAYFQPDSPVFTFLSRKRTAFQVIFSLLIAAVLSAVFAVGVAVLMRTHGIFGFLSAIGLVSFLIVKWVRDASSNIARGHLSDGAQEGASVISLLIVAFMVNVCLAAIFSAKDLFVFLSESVHLDNFVHYAESISVGREENNGISRALVNLYLVMDTFKMAVANEVLAAFEMGAEDKVRNFYLFYGLVFILNLGKLIPLSFALVFFFKGFLHFFVPSINRMFDRLGQVALFQRQTPGRKEEG